MLTRQSLETYVAELASGQPTPGGGSAAALVGALAAALGEMVGNFTRGKEGWAQVEPSLQRLTACSEALLLLTNQDATAYEQVAAAFALPRESEEDKGARSLAIQEALKGAAQVPLTVIREVAAGVAELPILLEHGNKNVLSDVGVAAELSRAAARCAWLNVEVNLAYLKDAQFVADVRAGLEDLIYGVEKTAAEVWQDTVGRLVGGA